MESLLQDLQRTIRALETLSEKASPMTEQIDELLDQLFQQKIDIANAILNPSSTLYQQAAQAMHQAAARAEKAARDPSRQGEAIAAVSEGIGHVAKLLDTVLQPP